MPKNNYLFSKNLITWYLDNKRALPWRQTKDPYRVWLSEIILQQTRVAQGLPYYNAFVAAYPTVQALAAAPEEAVLKLWQGLGYYSRARNLRITALFVANELKGVFPDNYNDLKKLKGVGDYTASAIASICFDAPTAVVDGNVYRVLSRVFGIDTPINSAKGVKDFKHLAQTLIDEKQPGTYNQAIMEFGARYCVPQNPDCKHCIFTDRCAAFGNGSVAKLPVKLKKLKVKKRYFNYGVIRSADGKTIVKQRLGKGIWQQLYEFPLVESDKVLSLKEFQNAFASAEILDRALDGSEVLNIQAITKYNDQPVVHKLSHQHLITTFWIVETNAIHGEGVPFSEVMKYPVPILIGNFIERVSFFN